MDWQRGASPRPGASPGPLIPITLRADERRQARRHAQRAALLRLRLTAAIQGVVDLARGPA